MIRQPVRRSGRSGKTQPRAAYFWRRRVPLWRGRSEWFSDDFKRPRRRDEL